MPNVRAVTPDVAYRLLNRQEYPSWLYPVKQGATTIWERWDSMLPDGTINPGEMTSFNHYAFGAIGAAGALISYWMINHTGVPHWIAFLTCVAFGGAVTFLNPEPLAPFADLVASGEGERLVPAASLDHLHAGQLGGRDEGPAREVVRPGAARPLARTGPCRRSGCSGPGTRR